MILISMDIKLEEGLRIPALLELQPFPFHGLSVQDIISLDWQMHRRPRIGQNRLRENQIILCRPFRTGGNLN